MRRKTARLLVDGLVAGLIGYAIIVVSVAMLDMIHGNSPFYSPALLGSVLFFGLRDAAQLTIWPGAVLAFNGAHVLVSVGMGMMLSWLITFAERRPNLWYVSFMLYLFVVSHVLGLPIWFIEPVRSSISLWMVAASTLAAAIGMTMYLLAGHPRLRHFLGFPVPARVAI